MLDFTGGGEKMCLRGFNLSLLDKKRSLFVLLPSPNTFCYLARFCSNNLIQFDIQTLKKKIQTIQVM